MTTQTMHTTRTTLRAGALPAALGVIAMFLSDSSDEPSAHRDG